MSLERFFVYSFAVHVLIAAAIIFSIPHGKENRKGGEIFTKLVSPDEFLAQKHVVVPLPKMGAEPYAPPKSAGPAPVIRGKGKLTEKRTFREETKKLSGSSKGNSHNLSSQPSVKRGYSGSPGETMSGPARDRNIPKAEDKPETSLREKLFDRNIISDLAKKNIEKEEKEKKVKTFTFDTSEYKFLIYNRRLKERIESIWIYPHDAVVKGVYGDLVIRFTIKKNGRLGAIELVRTSGHKNLDDAAMKALKDGEPYWPLPEEWGMEAYTIVGHFFYTIYGYYIM